MKCERCGKDFGNIHLDVCDNCGYDMVEGARIKKLLKEDPEKQVPENKKTDLIDYPILAFVLSIVGMILPVGIFSLLALMFSKKPAKGSLQAFSNVGEVFAIIGIAISALFIFCVVVWLFQMG